MMIYGLIFKDVQHFLLTFISMSIYFGFKASQSDNKQSVAHQCDIWVS